MSSICSSSSSALDNLYTQTLNNAMNSLPQQININNNNIIDIDYKMEYLKSQIILNDKNKYLKSATEVGNKLIFNNNQLKTKNSNLMAENVLIHFLITIIFILGRIT